jgi:serine/threonine protein kinase
MTGSPPNNRLRPFHPLPFGRYTLLMPLATGGMGEIFLARLGGPAGFEKFCVIKKILPALAQDRAFVERFMGEARVLVRLTHGSIAQVLDMGTVDGEPYMALEFVDGKDLRRLVSRVRETGTAIPVEVALFVMGRVLEALAYAHRKRDEQDREIQLVHRDISPQNVLLSYEGEVKVIDFGLAKSTLSDAKTNPSIILGKFLYMAPEQARHEKVDRRSDLYAVAICLYELLTGQNPFGHLGMTALMEAVMRPKVAPLQEVAPHVPADVCALVARGLEVDPGKRFQSAEEMRGALTAALSKLDPSLGQERISTFMREAFATEYTSERRLLQGLREAKAPEAAPEQDAHRDGATAVRRPMPASVVETAQVQLAAPLGPPPRARADDRTIPGVRLEDLEREAQDRTPTPEHEPAPVASMLDEEFLPVGAPTGPNTAPGEAMGLSEGPEPEQESASIQVSPELFEDEAAQSAAFRPTAKRYTEPDTGKLLMTLSNSVGTDPNVVVGATPRSGMSTGPNAPVNDTPRAGVPTGPGAAWTAPVTAPVRAIRSGPSWGLWGGLAAAVLLLGGGAAFVLGKKQPAPAPAPRPAATREAPAPVPVQAERRPEPPAPPEPPPEPEKDPTPVRPPEPEPLPPPRPAPAVAPTPARPVTATPAPPLRPAAKSSKSAVDEAWAQLRDRMERLDTLCGGNTRQAQKLRARFTGLEPFYRNEERDNDDVLRRLQLLVDDVDGCTLEAPR